MYFWLKDLKETLIATILNTTMSNGIIVVLCVRYKICVRYAHTHKSYKGLVTCDNQQTPKAMRLKHAKLAAVCL